MLQQIYMWRERDHINRVRHDNRFDNFRIVSQSENMRNITTPANNKSGHTGISESIIGIIPYFRVRIVNDAGRKLAKTFNIQNWEGLKHCVWQLNNKNFGLLNTTMEASNA